MTTLMSLFRGKDTLRQQCQVATRRVLVLRGAMRHFHFVSRNEVTPTTHQFSIGLHQGFLPIQEPLRELPPQFAKLESLLQRMPLNLPNGSKGLLAQGAFGDAVNKELPEYDVSKITDQRLLMALFRDYTFAASAYILEPCDIMYKSKNDYGLGRNVLPRNLAVPLTVIADKIGAKPFMEYAQSYALYNYYLKNPKGGHVVDNMELVRTFSGLPSERGFILVHVAMVAYTGNQVKYTAKILNSVKARDHTALLDAQKNLLETMQRINRAMDTMWSYSMPEDYMKFRTFIMGSKNQPMFPNGVIYEGVSEQPTYFRGESGANDSIIPTLDNITQVTEFLPSNDLTTILRDFRSYRPRNHNEWLSYVENESRNVGVRKFALSTGPTGVYHLALLDQIREFRARHWNFTKEYIIKRTSHPVATGGSPIVTYLPNQLGSVLDVMTDTIDSIELKRNELDAETNKFFDVLISRVISQRRQLDREVQSFKPKFKAQEAAEYDWSKERPSTASTTTSPTTTSTPVA